MGCERGVARPNRSLRKRHWSKGLKELGEGVTWISGGKGVSRIRGWCRTLEWEVWEGRNLL